MKKRILLTILFLFIIITPIASQSANSTGDKTAATMQLYPPQGYSKSNQLTFKVFFRTNAILVLSWGKALTGSSTKLKIGKYPGIYTTKSISISGNSASFTPSSVQLPVGRYYALVTTSAKNTLNEIQQDAKNNPSIDFSNEIQFIVESGTAPNTISPKGDITNSVPTFEWSPIPGVPGYWVILSSTPFQIVTLDNGEISIRGADIIWNYISDGTSVQYGEISPNSPYSSEAPPLIPNKEYNYTILNLYDLTDISSVSAVFSGVSSFTYKNVERITPPNLVSPVDSKVFYGNEFINFKWDPVKGANGYNIYILNRVSSFAGNEQQIDLPIWNSFTNNTSINFPARTTLSKGDYIWYVIAYDNSGAGNVSKKYKFKYDVSISPFTIRGYNSENNANLLSFEVKARSISQGVSPANPFLVSNSTSYVDSLVTGTYEFTATKDGFYDSTFVYQLSANNNTNVTIYLRPIPAIVSGEVKDNNNISIADATVSFKNITTGNTINVKSNLQGAYSKFMPKGSYKVEASKPGYKASDPVTVTVLNNQLMLSPIKLTKDIVTYSGKILNDEQKPVKQALVKATSGNLVRQQNTDESGNFSFTLSSGQWVIEPSKSGFISSGAKVFNFVPGDKYQNQIINLIPKANQVSGFVYRVVLSGGTTGYVPFPDVTVTAKPQSGSAISAVTNINGQFSLNLKSGSYTLEASKLNYTADQDLTLSMGVGETLSGIKFNLTSNKSSIAGIVSKSDGTGLGGVIIKTKAGESTETLPNGSYILSVASGSKTVSVSKSGYVSPDPLSVTVTAGQNLGNINFNMIANAGSISGKVTSLQTVLADAEITATSSTSSSIALSDQFGNYALNLKPGTYVITVRKSGFLPGEAKNITVGPGQQSSNNNFNLKQNTSNIGGAVQSNNIPLSNARIELKDKSSEKKYLLTTNVYGNYSASVEAGKSYEASISLKGYIGEKFDTEILSAGSNYNYNTSLDPAQATISGFILNENNQVLSNPEIHIRNIASEQAINVSPNADGSYTSGLPAGNYIIRCSAEGHVSDSVSITLERGQKTDNINFNLIENFAVVTGTIKDQNGIPIESVLVNISSENQTFTALTDAVGGYFISGLSGGYYSIHVSKENYSEETVSEYLVNPGDSKVLDFVLELQVGRINGFILSINSEPVVDATILLSGQGRQFSTNTDNNGYYEFVSLPLGNYLLDVIKTGYAENDSNSVVLEENNFDQELSISNLLTLNATVAGIVKDRDGNLLQGVSINLSGEYGSGSALTNISGEFSIDNLLSAEYDLLAALDGYSTVDTTVQANGGAGIEIIMVKNKSLISGRVVNQLGAPLSFLVPLIGISGNGEVYNTQTDSEGNFRFDDVGNNTDYTILTDIFKQGYVNDTTSFNLPAGTLSYSDVNLTVNVKNSRVYGSVGVEQAAITLTDNSKGSQNTVFAGSSGEYEFNFQSDGSYTLTPYLTGYIFTPSSRQFNLGARDTVSYNFVAEQNSGTIIVTARDNNGGFVEAAEAVIQKDDGTISITENTGSDGKAIINNIPAGNYEVRVSKAGYSTSPESRNVTLNVNSETNIEFTMRKFNSSISGSVKLVDNGNSSPIADASVQLTYQSGASYYVSTNSDGSYSFENIPAGSVRLKATSSGNSSEVISFQLADDENRSDVVLEIVASVVTLSGSVVYDGQGVEGVSIEALSSSTFEVVTNSSGKFNFINIPIKRGETDTTTFLIRINDENYPAKQTTVQIPSSARGSTISLPEFILPSGQISVLVTDGVNPLSGVNLNLSKPDGSVSTVITDETGLFRSSRLLSAGTYQVSVSKELFLQPEPSLSQVILPEDTTSILLEIMMPFMINTIDSVFADTQTDVVISSNISTSNYEGVIYYKLGSAILYQVLPLEKASNSFGAVIPALYSTEDLKYYVELTRSSDNVIYTSDVYSVSSYARGLLTAFEINPSIGNQIVRVNDKYTLRITIRDGLNKSINEQFKGSDRRGSIEWNNSDVNIINISQPDDNDPTLALLEVIRVGQASVSLSAELNGKVVSQDIALTATDIPLKNIVVNSPLRKLNNKSDGIQLSYSAVDTLDRNILLGDDVEWGLIPVAAGSISNNGVYIPVDSTYIGNSLVTLYDDISELTGSFEISVFAQINQNSSINLTNTQGMTLSIQRGAVEEPIEIAIGKAQFGPAKKHFTSLRNNITYTVSDEVYNIIYTGNSLPGDSLLIPASFELPLSSSLEFFEGEQSIGLYDPVEKEWITMPVNSALAKSLITSQFYRFGEYSILSENEPLGIKHLSVLPSPFSPVVAPVKIGYFLTTNFPPAAVTIKIYNIRGELVRTLLDNDIQYPGKFGSKSSQKEIFWDGLTDQNYLARNGRYIIQVSVKDKEDEINKLIQVVLIK